MPNPYRWIKWEQYPKKKPGKADDYLVTMKQNKKNFVAIRFFNGSRFYFDDEKILAFCRCPDPYRGEMDDIDLI